MLLQHVRWPAFAADGPIEVALAERLLCLRCGCPVSMRQPMRFIIAARAHRHALTRTGPQPWKRCRLGPRVTWKVA